MLVLERRSFDELFGSLMRRGYAVRGPTVRQGAIVIDEIRSSRDLPAGWTDSQREGGYRLERRPDEALFAFNVGPDSWKKLLFPPQRRLWASHRNGRSFDVVPEPIDPPSLALLGVRACDLAALGVQDRVFLKGEYVDPYYKAQRERLFIVAVNCAKAGGTCFCVSMKTGPRAREGFDLALTEIVGDGAHYFLIEAGSDAGSDVLAELPTREASPSETALAEEQAAATAAGMKKSLNTQGIKELMYRNAENPRWEQIAQRCLSCANCTLVCPTCFCHTVEEVVDLTGDHAERWRKWDSCFTTDFSYIHGGPVRSTTQARYRQWLTHKLAAWLDQFGTSGCVGCGRCITWCPVGIDLTEEAALLRERDLLPPGSTLAREDPAHAG